MKPSPERLRLDVYPVQIPLQARFSDLDVLQHINNVAMADLFLESRVRMFRSIRERTPDWTNPLVVASLSIAYLRDALYPEPITGACAIVAIGRTSFTVAQAMFQDGVCVSAADVVQVHRDANGPAPLPQDLRAELGAISLRI